MRDKLKIGTKVRYDNGFGKIENGIIKGYSMFKDNIFVVYHCGGDWENYKNYTGASTPIKDLKLGWI